MTELSEEIKSIINEYFKPYKLDSRIISRIESTRRRLSKKGIGLTDDLIVKALRITVEVAEAEAIRLNDIDNLQYYLSEALRHRVFERYIIQYLELKGYKV